MKLTDLAVDSEDEEHSPAERLAAASRSTWVSVGVNLLLTCLQIAAGIFAKSQGLIADGIHSLSDLVADFVVLLPGITARKTLI
jgi:divalent metal cation (Fe/Co/Zn/Cd) transporter